jgi:hypothetical protein
MINRKMAFSLERYLLGLSIERLREVYVDVGAILAEREKRLAQAKNLKENPLTPKEQLLYSGIRSGRTKADRTKG